MADVVKGIYQAAFFIWNELVGIAVTLMTTSPMEAAAGKPYGRVHVFFNTISDAAIPIATVFFIIAIYKSVVSSPPHQQAMRFMQDTIKYCIILVVAANAWEIMGYIMQFCDGITKALDTKGTYGFTLYGDVTRVIDAALYFPPFDFTAEWFDEFWTCVGNSFTFLLGGIVLIIIVTASSISIISSAFQRIIKPLIILPFAGIAVALGAGSTETTRSMYSYFKTFFGLCLSGAVMVLAVKTGSALSSTFVSFEFAGMAMSTQVMLITVQAAATPIVIAGLVKGADALVARMF